MDKFFVKVNDSEISVWYPQGDTIRICFNENINGNRLEFGHMKKESFRRPKFIMCDCVPTRIVQSIGLVSSL